MFQGILIGFAILIICVLSRSITTLIHELGHALPALWFTKKNVSIYVGSYGDLSHSLKIKTGRLTSYLKINLFSWHSGLCTHQGVTNTWQRIVIILGGPFFSIILSLVLVFVLQNENLSEITKALVGLFVVSSVIDFLANVIPARDPLMLHNGQQTYNDGTQLMTVLRSMSYPENYQRAINYYNSDNRIACIAELKKIVALGKADAEIFRLLLECLLEEKEFEEAEKQIEIFQKKIPSKAIDFKLIGQIKMAQSKNKEAIQNFSKALYWLFKDANLLNLRGEAIMRLGEYELAEKDFYTAVQYQPKFIPAQINLGVAQIKNGKRKEGFLHLQNVYQTEPENPNCHLQLGHYYNLEKEYQQSHFHFSKAKALGLEHHGLDFYLADVQNKLES